MKSVFLAIAAVGAIAATAASAQDVAFRGFRVEGNAGWDRYSVQGNHNGKFGFGGQAGFDGQIGKKIVIGVEGNYWQPENRRNTVAFLNQDGDTRFRQSRYEYGSAIRVGYLITPDLLVFGKGGYVRGDERIANVSPGGDVVRNLSRRDSGYQYGGGVEYTLHDKVSFVPTGVYVSAQYVRDEFEDNASDQHVMGGVGIRFR